MGRTKKSTKETSKASAESGKPNGTAPPHREPGPTPSSTKSKSTPNQSGAKGPTTQSPASQTEHTSRTPKLKSGTVRPADEWFIKNSIVFHVHKYKESWHHCKDIKALFVAQRRAVRSVMYPITSDDLGMDDCSFNTGAVVTFKLQTDAEQVLTLNAFKDKAVPFHKMQGLPIINVLLKAKGIQKSKQKEALEKLKKDIEDPNCGFVTEIFTGGLRVEVYEFQLKSLAHLIKGTPFEIKNVTPLAVEPDEALGAGADACAGTGTSAGAVSGTGSGTSSGDGSGSCAGTSAGSGASSRAGGGSGTGSGGGSGSGTGSGTSSDAVSGATFSAGSSFGPGSGSGAGSDTDADAPKPVSPGLEERSPVPTGDKQKQKKAVLANMNKRRAGKTEDGSTDETDPMSHKRKETAPKVPPRLPIPQTQAPGKSATGTTQPPKSPIGTADLGESAVVKVKDVKDSKEEKKKALSRATEKGKQLKESIPDVEEPSAAKDGEETETAMGDTTAHSDESIATIVTKDPEDHWEEYPDRYSLTLEKYTCKYIKKFHAKDFEILDAKVEVKATEVVIYKGKKDKQRAKRAKEEITTVIDAIAPPQYLVKWKSQTSDAKSIVEKYNSVAYLEIDKKQKTLALVTKKDDFDRIKEELESLKLGSDKKPSSVSSAKQDDDKSSDDPTTARSTRAAEKAPTTEHPEEDDDEKRGSVEPVCKKPSKLEPLGAGATNPSSSPPGLDKLPPIPRKEDSTPSGGESTGDTKPFSDPDSTEMSRFADEIDPQKSQKGQADCETKSETKSSESDERELTTSPPPLPPKRHERETSDHRTTSGKGAKTPSKTTPAPKPAKRRPPVEPPERDKSDAKTSSGKGAKKQAPKAPPAPKVTPAPKSGKRAPPTEPQSEKSSVVKSKRGRQLAAPDPMSFHSTSSTLVVHVLVYDITALPVEAIVNAANRRLQHGGGVAWAIAKAAGKSLTRECDEYIRRRGPLDVTANMVSRAGNLPCKAVIHAVGPMMKYYKNSKDGFRDVHRTFRNVIDTATRKSFFSIAIPAISSGIFGVPTEIVAGAMVEVISDLAAKQTSLQEVYLVDITPDVINIIQQDMARRSEFVALDFSGLQLWEAPQPRAKSKTPADEPDDTLLSDPPEDYDKDTDCSICMGTAEIPKLIKQCGHVFCLECIQTAFSHKPVCPMCGVVVGKVFGDQPDNGDMSHSRKSFSLDGYPMCGTIVINYYFPDGIQQENHPNPGRRFRGTERTAYLPDNSEGQKVLWLLEKAFDQRLVFTVGQSRTTGRGDTVTWNDIHHKTNTTGGSQRFGYPDPTYLSRVQEELAAKGIK